MADERVMWLVHRDEGEPSFLANMAERAWKIANVYRGIPVDVLKLSGWRCSRIVVEDGDGE